jgi:hypothetical protein
MSSYLPSFNFFSTTTTKPECKPLEDKYNSAKAAADAAKKELDACQTKPATPAPETVSKAPVAQSATTEPKKGLLGFGYFGLGGKKKRGGKKSRHSKKSKKQTKKSKKTRSQKKH